MNTENITTKNPFVDLHAHLQFSDFDNDRADTLSQMKENNVIAVNVGVDKESSENSIKLAKDNQNLLWSTIGLHPLYPEQVYDLEDILSDEEKRSYICGIGECGLDYFRIEEGEGKSIDEIKDFQREIFIKQI